MQSFLTNSRFVAQFPDKDLRDVSNSVQEFQIPDVNVEPATQTSRQRDIPQPGSKIVYAPLNLKFIVDGDGDIYWKVYDWLVDTYKSEEPEKDLVVHVFDQNENRAYSVKFFDAFPVDLISTTMILGDQNDTPVTFSSTFHYSHFEKV